MKKSILLSLILLSLTAVSCRRLAAFLPNTYDGNGTITSDVRTPGTFASLELDGAYNVVLTQGSTSEVRVETDQNLLGHIKTSVQDGKLVVESDGNLLPSKRITLYITSPNYSSIEANGSADIRSTTPITAPELKLALNGSGSYTLGLNVNHLTSEIEGAGTITLSGTAREHSIEIDGSGNLLTDQLAVDTASIEISGSGDASMNVASRLEAAISGSGRVRYRGPVTDIHTDISGSGSVSRLRE